MNLVQCRNGHYYDGDRYNTCPHCQETENMDAQKDVTVPMDPPADPSVSGSAEPSFAVTEPLTVTGKNMEEIIDDEEKTVGYYSDVSSGAEPVVGWLVCVEGIDFGRSFDLKAGKNFIGRNPIVNDIVLQGDNSVSREKHAIVVYDPKSSAFIVQPGMSSELFYVNEKVILQATVIKMRDIISVGNTKLMFMPFCGPDFSWDDYKDKDKE